MPAKYSDDDLLLGDVTWDLVDDGRLSLKTAIACEGGRFEQAWDRSTVGCCMYVILAVVDPASANGMIDTEVRSYARSLLPRHLANWARLVRDVAADALAPGDLVARWSRARHTWTEHGSLLRAICHGSFDDLTFMIAGANLAAVADPRTRAGLARKNFCNLVPEEEQAAWAPVVRARRLSLDFRELASVLAPTAPPAPRPGA